MTNFKNLKVDDVLGETNYYKVEKIKGDEIQLLPDGGQSIVVEKGYVEKYLQSGDQFDKEEKITKTELAELFIAKARSIMSVCFIKQNTKKTKKAYKAEIDAKVIEVQNAPVSKVEGLLRNLLENPILDYIPGELRVMRGRHHGDIDDLGRVKFVDMDIDGAHNTRQVDPRTIQWLIVDNVKYILK